MDKSLTLKKKIILVIHWECLSLLFDFNFFLINYLFLSVGHKGVLSHDHLWSMAAIYIYTLWLVLFLPTYTIYKRLYLSSVKDANYFLSMSTKIKRANRGHSYKHNVFKMITTKRLYLQIVILYFILNKITIR